jgi:hypothetical protein
VVPERPACYRVAGVALSAIAAPLSAARVISLPPAPRRSATCRSGFTGAGSCAAPSSRGPRFLPLPGRRCPARSWSRCWGARRSCVCGSRWRYAPEVGGRSPRRNWHVKITRSCRLAQHTGNRIAPIGRNVAGLRASQISYAAIRRVRRRCLPSRKCSRRPVSLHRAGFGPGVRAPSGVNSSPKQYGPAERTAFFMRTHLLFESVVSAATKPNREHDETAKGSTRHAREAFLPPWSGVP